MAGQEDLFEAALNQTSLEDCLTPEDAGEMVNMILVEHAKVRDQELIRQRDQKRRKAVRGGLQRARR